MVRLQPSPPFIIYGEVGKRYSHKSSELAKNTLRTYLSLLNRVAPVRSQRRQVLMEKLNRRNEDGSVNAYHDNPTKGFGYYVRPNHPDFRQQIEDGIWPAVEILMKKGYKTVISCHGHYCNRVEDGTPYIEAPYVTILLDSRKADYLIGKLGEKVVVEVDNTMGSLEKEQGEEFLRIRCRDENLNINEACGILIEALKNIDAE